MVVNGGSGSSGQGGPLIKSMMMTRGSIPELVNNPAFTNLGIYPFDDENDNN